MLCLQLLEKSHAQFSAERSNEAHVSGSYHVMHYFIYILYTVL